MPHKVYDFLVLPAPPANSVGYERRQCGLLFPKLETSVYRLTKLLFVCSYPDPFSAWLASPLMRNEVVPCPISLQP